MPNSEYSITIKAYTGIKTTYTVDTMHVYNKYSGFGSATKGKFTPGEDHEHYILKVTCTLDESGKLFARVNSSNGSITSQSFKAKQEPFTFLDIWAAFISENFCKELKSPGNTGTVYFKKNLDRVECIKNGDISCYSANGAGSNSLKYFADVVVPQLTQPIDYIADAPRQYSAVIKEERDNIEDEQSSRAALCCLTRC